MIKNSQENPNKNNALVALIDVLKDKNVITEEEIANKIKDKAK